MVEFGKTPINQTKFSVGMINHNIVWLYISVSDTFRVAVIESTQNLKNVVTNIKVCETLVQCAEVYITGINVLHYQSWCLSHWITYHIDKVDDVYSALKSLENLNFTSYFGLLNWLENLDNNALACCSVYSLVYF